MWQYIFGIQLYWVIVPLAVMLLLAVGADYNLLLISRFKEEMHAGLKTGNIRAMAGTGGVVTAAGLVFAATMSSFIVSDLVMLGQLGTTIGLGLLFDTLIVRSFMTPSIATLLGRWFWWPLNVRPVQPARCCAPTAPASPSGSYSATSADRRPDRPRHRRRRSATMTSTRGLRRSGRRNVGGGQHQHIGRCGDVLGGGPGDQSSAGIR